MHASLGRARSLVRFLGRFVALVLVAGATAHGLAGCTHAGGKVPVDSPVYAFQPADPDDYSQDGDSDDDDSDDSGGDTGDSADGD